jgi:hypothetical protein
VGKEGKVDNMTHIKEQYNITGSAITQGNHNNIAFKSSGATVSSTIDDHSTHTSIEIRDCVINLQGELNNLAKDLRNKDFADDADYVEEVVAAVVEAQEIIDASADEATIETEIKKRGVFAKIKGFYEELTDDNSNLSKNTATLRNGAKKVQSLLKVYNEFAKLIPVLPQIPDILLNAGKTS